jgi:omega-6 fatty acid desaturase (delta-12 desaturase)
MQRLAPSSGVGTCITGVVGLTTAAGIAASSHAHPAIWLAGQLLLAVALLQWFVVLHEAGHLTLFANRAANVAVGHVAGFFALIPFESWRRVHGLHHVWTGWQDRDPTTAALVPRTLAPLERLLVDWAWRLWLPLFSTLYRLNNYWHLPRIARFFGAPRARRAMALNACVLLALYVALAAALGPWELLRYAGLATFLTLAMQDPLILSQHTHLAQNVSGGQDVAPLPPAEQERFTRSLRFPGWVARWVLFHFDAHELHHGHARVPGYRLRDLGRAQANEVDWWTWLRGAKRLRGSVFLFSNRDATGFRL